jgi:hypothetical protein
VAAATLNDMPKPTSGMRSDREYLVQVLQAMRQRKGGDQLRFSNGDFPDDITSLQLLPIILLCWSLEFPKEVEKISRSAGVSSPFFGVS